MFNINKKYFKTIEKNFKVESLGFYVDSIIIYVLLYNILFGWSFSDIIRYFSIKLCKVFYSITPIYNTLLSGSPDSISQLVYITILTLIISCLLFMDKS